MSNWLVLVSRFLEGDMMDRNWPANCGVEEEEVVKGLGTESWGSGAGEGDSRFMERVWERRVGGWSRWAKREVCVAWRRMGEAVSG